jgi:hypothetical protein
MSVAKQFPTMRPPTARPVRAGSSPLVARSGHGNAATARLFRMAKKDDEECPKCAGKLHRRAGPGKDPGEVPPIVYDVLRSPGRPLDEGVRTDMEQRFGGADFGGVRIHTDAKAAESAEAVNARAYTVGQHIAFGEARSSAERLASQVLLAHELAHVTQSPVSGPATANLSVASSTDLAEIEARHVASQFDSTGFAGMEPSSGQHSTNVLRRQTESQSVALSSTPTEEIVDATLSDAEVMDGDTEVTGSDSPMSEGPLDRGGQMLSQSKAVVSELFGSETQGAQNRQTKRVEPRWVTHIEISLASQGMTLIWSDGTVSGPHTISSGKGLPNTADDPCRNQTERNCTPAGQFTVSSRRGASARNSHGDAMAWYVGFVDERGIGIHNSQIANGTPLSHGCIRVGKGEAATAFAKLINQNIKIGKTVVNVAGKAPTKPWSKRVKKRK